MRESAVLAAVLQGGSLKSLCHGERATYAIVSETLKRRQLLERALDAAGVAASAPEERAEALLLAHDLLFGRGLRRRALADAAKSAEARAALLQLRRWQTTLLRAARERRGGGGGGGGGSSSGGGDRAASARGLPRYARVNTLKVRVADVVAALEAEGFRRAAPRREAPPAAGEFWLDEHVPELLVLPEGTELHQHHLVRSAALILQEKASCLSPAALAPPAACAGALVVDATAAPGNKSTFSAARVAPSGRVIALERDQRRAQTLARRSALAADGAVSVDCVDFLAVDPASPPYNEATLLLLDPSCSGSGIVERGAAHGAQGDLSYEGAEDEGADVGADEARRVRALAAMQLRLLLHALSFPAAKAVVYSTCSVHPLEDELVVAAALRRPEVSGAWRLAPALESWPCRGLPLFDGGGLCLRAGPEQQTNGFFVARFERRTGREKSRA